MAKEVLKKYGQEHIISWMDKLTNDEKEKLVKQVLDLNIGQVVDLYNNLNKTFEIGDKKIEKISAFDISKLSEEEFKKYKSIGEEFIKNNEYAVITMAGGQGTRLGHSGPKGTFKISVNNGDKYLFQIIVESLQKANEKYGVVIPWYIMTSDENNDQTLEFLRANNFFGYDKQKVKLFKQGKAPLISTKGKLLIGKDKLIKEASDGNGSIYSSMKKHKILEDMKQKNIEWVYICSVDNILLKMVEPILLGLTIKQNNQIASKTIVKANAKERVGAFCKKNGRPSVIEYTELPEDMAKLADENQELVFGEAHIMCNLFSIKAIEQIAEKTLPYHIAHKKINHYIDGKQVESEIPNAYKFEQFIFDSFPLFENITLLRGKREEDFAPVKNKEGNDSPKTAAELYNNYWKV